MSLFPCEFLRELLLNYVKLRIYCLLFLLVVKNSVKFMLLFCFLSVFFFIVSHIILFYFLIQTQLILLDPHCPLVDGEELNLHPSDTYPVQGRNFSVTEPRKMQCLLSQDAVDIVKP